MRRKIVGQRTIKCGHCGKPKNFLSTWVAVHEGRVCYTCLRSGHIQIVKED